MVWLIMILIQVALTASSAMAGDATGVAAGVALIALTAALAIDATGRK